MGDAFGSGKWHLRETDAGETVIAQHFTGPMQFANMCATTKPEPKWLKSGYSSDKAQSDWNGGTTWSETIKLCMNGWRNGWQDVHTDMIEIEDEMRPIRPRTHLVTGYHGTRPHVGNYIAGLPKNMIRPRRHRVNAPAVRLNISIGALYNVDSEAYRRRGAAVCAYIDAVETAGISTEIRAISRAKGGYGSRGAIAEVSIQLKDAGQPLDIDAVAFCLGHPAMLRRLVFRWREKDVLWPNFNSGYGSSQNPTEEDGYLRINTMTKNDNHLSAQEWYDKISSAVSQERTTL